MEELEISAIIAERLQQAEEALHRRGQDSDSQIDDEIERVALLRQYLSDQDDNNRVRLQAEFFVLTDADEQVFEAGTFCKLSVYAKQGMVRVTIGEVSQDLTALEPLNLMEFLSTDGRSYDTQVTVTTENGSIAYITREWRMMA